jgi:hypothetical protein
LWQVREQHGGDRLHKDDSRRDLRISVRPDVRRRSTQQPRGGSRQVHPGYAHGPRHRVQGERSEIILKIILCIAVISAPTGYVDPPPLPLHVTKAGKNHLNEEIITPLLSTGIGERYCQTISNLGHAGCSALAPM